MQDQMIAKKQRNQSNQNSKAKICSWWEARENMLTIPSAGKQANDTKRGKTCSQFQPMPSAGKRGTTVKRGKTQTYYHWQSFSGKPLFVVPRFCLCWLVKKFVQIALTNKQKHAVSFKESVEKPNQPLGSGRLFCAEFQLASDVFVEKG